MNDVQPENNLSIQITRKSAYKAPSRSRKLAKVMHEFTEKIGITFANFLDLGPHSQPKRKLINISGERGHYLYLNKKGLHIGTTSLFGILHSSETDKHRSRTTKKFVQPSNYITLSA